MLRVRNSVEQGDSCPNSYGDKLVRTLALIVGPVPGSLIWVDLPPDQLQSSKDKLRIGSWVVRCWQGVLQ